MTQSHNTGGIGASNQELFNQRGGGLVPDICGCLSDGAHNGGGLNGQDAYTGRIIPVACPSEVALLSGGDVCRTLSARHDSSPCAVRGQEIIAICDVTHGDKSCNGKGWNDDGSAYTLDTIATQGVAFVQNTRDEVRLFGGDGQTVGSLSAQPGMKQQSYIAQPCVLWSIMPQNGGKDYKARMVDVSQPVMAGGQTHGNQGGDVVQNGMQVRRFTPRECERLQGLPDDWTLIPWRGKPAADCPDGPRYKGIGNGQTVNVMRWLAERIKKAIAV